MKQRNLLSIRFFGVLLAWCAISMAGDSQTSRSPETLRTTTRLVVVDVVATDSKGQAGNDLKAEDFTVLESGQPQKVRGFNFQHPRATPQPTPAQPPPPNLGRH